MADAYVAVESKLVNLKNRQRRWEGAVSCAHHVRGGPIP